MFYYYFVFINYLIFRSNNFVILFIYGEIKLTYSYCFTCYSFLFYWGQLPKDCFILSQYWEIARKIARKLQAHTVNVGWFSNFFHFHFSTIKWFFSSIVGLCFTSFEGKLCNQCSDLLSWNWWQWFHVLIAELLNVKLHWLVRQQFMPWNIGCRSKSVYGELNVI